MLLIIVTHGGMMNQMYYELLNLPIVNNVFFPTGDAGIHIWKIKNGNTYIVNANVTTHTEGI